jgi:hypothetical protein
MTRRTWAIDMPVSSSCLRRKRSRGPQTTVRCWELDVRIRTHLGLRRPDRMSRRRGGRRPGARDDGRLLRAGAPRAGHRAGAVASPGMSNPSRSRAVDWVDSPAAGRQRDGGESNGEPNLRELEPDCPLVKAVGRNCARVLFGVELIDPFTFVGVILLILLVAALELICQDAEPRCYARSLHCETADGPVSRAGASSAQALPQRHQLTRNR